MKVDYDNFSKTFAKSRKNMKWEELQYFFKNYVELEDKKSILDIGCGSGRLLEQFGESFSGNNYDYLGIDLSAGMIEEAQKNFPEKHFQVLDMLEIDRLEQQFDYIFLIASYHHLKKLADREEVMDKLFQITKKGGIICFTNWALKSEIHKDRYKVSEIQKSENQFGSTDFLIKIGKFERFYHCFSVAELKYLAQKAGFQIIENREFDNKKNIITVLKKV